MRAFYMRLNRLPRELGFADFAEAQCAEPDQAHDL